MQFFYKTMPSPLGILTLVANEKGLVSISWEGDKTHTNKFLPLMLDINQPILCEAEKQLREYFAKQRTQFDLPLAFHGTDFQLKVWQSLLTIPYGSTMSYGELAKNIAAPKASRAVGAANGRNSLPIVVPCHRVIGADGSLTGFTGGLNIKSYLLALEGII